MRAKTPQDIPVKLDALRAEFDRLVPEAPEGALRVAGRYLGRVASVAAVTRRYLVPILRENPLAPRDTGERFPESWTDLDDTMSADDGTEDVPHRLTREDNR